MKYVRKLYGVTRRPLWACLLAVICVSFSLFHLQPSVSIFSQVGEKPAYITLFQDWQRYIWQSEAYFFKQSFLLPDKSQKDNNDPLQCQLRMQQLQQLRHFPGASATTLDVVQAASDRFYRLNDSTEKRRILFYADLHRYLTAMDRYWFHMFFDAQFCSHWEALIWGPGFPGYDETLCLGDNLRQRFPFSPKLDVIMYRYPWEVGNKTHLDIPMPEEDQRNLRDLPGRPIIALVHHEMHFTPDGLRKLYEDAARSRTIHFVSYSGYVDNKPVEEIMKTRVGRHAQLAPHGVPSFILQTKDDDLHRATDCSNENGQWRSKWTKSQRTDNFFFAGALDWWAYPLRRKIATLSEEHAELLKYQLKHTKHPGYLESEIKNSTENKCRERLRRVLPIYANFMQSARKAKICIVGRGERALGDQTLHYAVRKYQEAMAAGCLIAGDLPDNPDIAQHVGVVLDANMTNEDIARRLNNAIDDYNRGLYDEHIKRAYCAVERTYTYHQLFTQYYEPAFTRLALK